MPELPHLRLYLRRVTAAPKGLSVAEALRTARLRALLAVLGWILAAVTMQALQLGALSELIQTSNYNQWLRDAPGFFYVLVTSLGVWGLLFLAADEMQSIAVQGRRGASPDWYSAPIESWRALLATLLAALCASAPMLLGLLLFIFLSGGWAEVSSLPLAPLRFPQFWQLAVAMPMYCLACAAFALALRGSVIGSQLPLLLSLGGMLLSLTQYELRLAQSGAWVQGTTRRQLLAAGIGVVEADPQPLLLLLGGCALAVLLALLLLQISRRHETSAVYAVPLLILLLMLTLIPPVRQAGRVASQLRQGWLYFDETSDIYGMPKDSGLLLARHLAAGVWPSSLAQPYRRDGSNDLRIEWTGTVTAAGAPGYIALSPALPYDRLLPLRLLQVLLMTALWWLAGVAALNAVRYPRTRR